MRCTPAILLVVVSAGCGGGTSPDPGELGPDARPGDPAACGQLRAVIRDFAVTHPDFEEPDGNSDVSYPGLVEPMLGADGTPVYAHPGPIEPHTEGPDAFAQWFHDVDGVNQRFEFVFDLADQGGGVQGFDSAAFFPIDGEGFGNEGFPHNFHFTTEVHTSFLYRGGELFRFRGDDDLWLFVNGRLAIDLGGLHPALDGSVDLDAGAAALGIAPGGTYDMDIFHAERHGVASNFRIETTIDCFIVK